MSGESLAPPGASTGDELTPDWVRTQRREIEQAAQARLTPQTSAGRLVTIRHAAQAAYRLERLLSDVGVGDHQTDDAAEERGSALEHICSALLTLDVHVLIVMGNSEAEPTSTAADQIPIMDWRGMTGSAAQIAFAYARRARFDAAMALAPTMHGLGAPDREATVQLLRAVLSPLRAFPSDVIAHRIDSLPARWRPQAPPPQEREWRVLKQAMGDCEETLGAAATPRSK